MLLLFQYGPHLGSSLMIRLSPYVHIGVLYITHMPCHVCSSSATCTLKRSAWPTVSAWRGAQEHSTVAMASSPDSTSFLQKWEQQLKVEYVDIMGEMEDTPQGQRVKYLNWNHFFSCLFNEKPDGQAKLAEYLDKVKALLRDVLRVAPGPGNNKEVPEKLPDAPQSDDSGEGEPQKFRLNLWHLPFHAAGPHVFEGAPPMCGFRSWCWP